MQYIIPAMLFSVILMSLFLKKPVYEQFIEGASDGLLIIKSILPPILAIMVAVEMLRASGAFSMLFNLIAPVFSRLGAPYEILPLVLVRPLSGSGATGIFSDILNTYGADSEIGKIASVINGSTETTFYCLAVYFSKTRVKNTLRAIPCAVIGDITGIIVGILVIKLLNF